jgi:hypothetical protein
MVERVSFEPITLEDIRSFVRHKVDQLFDLEPDGDVCSRVLMFLSAEIDKLEAKSH